MDSFYSLQPLLQRLERGLLNPRARLFDLWTILNKCISQNCDPMHLRKMGENNPEEVEFSGGEVFCEGRLYLFDLTIKFF